MEIPKFYLVHKFQMSYSLYIEKIHNYFPIVYIIDPDRPRKKLHEDSPECTRLRNLARSEPDELTSPLQAALIGQPMATILFLLFETCHVRLLLKFQSFLQTPIREHFILALNIVSLGVHGGVCYLLFETHNVFNDKLCKHY